MEVSHKLPTVGVIRDIYLVNGDRLIFHIEQYHTSFEPHYRAYVLEKHPFCLRIICHSSLYIHTSVHVRTSPVSELSQHFVILPFALCVVV